MLNRIFILFFLCIWVYSCANIAPLEGGPKDEKPPEIAKATPENRSTNFKGGRIRIQFDEFISIKNQQKEIVVTPPIAAFPEVKPNIRHVDVTIADSLLKPNTTYTINFGNSIADNNEGNILSNYTYIFSTGNEIDSAYIKVKIVDAQTLLPAKDAKLQLYDQILDSTIFKESPYYVGNVATSGIATANYMREGSFEAIALGETQVNYLYNQGEDYIGFLDSKLSTNDTNVTTIYVFKEPTKNLKVLSAKANQKGSISFKLNGSAENVDIKTLNDSLPAFASSHEFIGTNYDSIVYWYPLQAPDTLYFQITYPSGNVDTSRVVAKATKTTTSGTPTSANRSSRGSNNNATSNSGNATAVKNGLLFSHNLTADIDYFDTIQFTFNQPVKSLKDSIIAIKDGNTIVYPKVIFKDKTQRKAAIIFPMAENKGYELFVKDSSFYSIWGFTNDSLRISFKTTTKLEYTSLTLNIQNMNYQGNVIFSLLNQSDAVLQTQQIQFPNDNAQLVFTMLKAGNYRVRLTYDANQNGKWDSGNYSRRIQPERVTFFPKTIDIKRGFASEFDWDLEGN